MSRLMKVRAQLIDKVTKLPIQDIDVLTSTDCVYFPDGETLEEKWNRGDLKGDPGNDGEDGVSATMSIGEVLTVDSNSLAAVENVGTMTAAILNFKIPKGEKGEAGTSVKILGRFETYEELIAAYPDGTNIDGGFMVGPEGGPQVYYYWDKMVLKWISAGSITGPKGDKGETGEDGKDGMGLAIFDTVENYEALIEKYPDGSVCNGGGVVTINTGEYWYWNILRDQWCSIGKVTGVAGPKGEKGDPATIKISSVNTVEADTLASVINIGTDDDVQLVFNIPRGFPGETPEIIIDPDLSSESENPVANKAIAEEFSNVKKDIAELFVKHLDDLTRIEHRIVSASQYENVSSMLKLI